MLMLKNSNNWGAKMTEKSVKADQWLGFQQSVVEMITGRFVSWI